MEILSYQQRIAILRILLDIINADGRIDEREVFFFNKVASELDLKEEDFVFAKDANSLLCLLELRYIGDEEKLYLAKIMGQQIVADYDINVNEKAIYDLVCQICSIDIKFEDIITEEQLANSTKS